MRPAALCLMGASNMLPNMPTPATSQRSAPITGLELPVSLDILAPSAFDGASVERRSLKLFAGATPLATITQGGPPPCVANSHPGNRKKT